MPTAHKPRLRWGCIGLWTLILYISLSNRSLTVRIAEMKVTYQTPKERHGFASHTALLSSYKSRLPIAAPKRSRFDDLDECRDVDMRRIEPCKFD